MARVTAFLALLGFVRALTPAQIMMHERRKEFCAPGTVASNDAAFMSCDECKAYEEHLTDVLKHETRPSQHYKIARDVCNKFVSMFGHNSTIKCPSLLKTFLKSIEYVIQADKLPDVCHLVGLCPDRDLATDDYMNMNEAGLNESTFPVKDIRFRDLKHKTPLKNILIDAWPRTMSNSSNITFVQISDIHFDPEYAEGSPTQCARVVCCHKVFQEDAMSAEYLFAGPFGDFNCDAPEKTITAILDFILTLDPQPDFFVYVGDSSVHALLESMKKKLEDNLRVNNLLVEKLRGIGPIYPAMGNHESHNNHAVHSISQRRCHKVFIIGQCGKHSYKVNIFAVLGRFDPVWNKQKDFVRDTLERARDQNAKVIFLSHMRPRYLGTYPEYAQYLDSLMAEFEDVIVLQLYGHDHDDSFLVHRDMKNTSRVVGTSLSAPSVTPFYDLRKGVNPAIRVFTLEAETWRPLDYTQYYVDLEESNSENNITLKFQYQFTEEYNLTDMSPASFASLSDRIYTDWVDFQIYENNLQVLTGGREKCSMDDLRCRRLLTCHTRTAEPRAYAACLRGESLF
ncbi:chitin binding beak protein 1 [Plakobranchus ocellatus]|uniref:Chitin binding beak protein 1 n=1 Tax=Plakobranchus ocellatus TaxID=259542 RepID=A0AAV3YH33_9GAST|nr:chitin binding beak protein 1 [Plakobranchus ocellatus]